MENENLETTTTEVEETAQTPTEEKQEKEKTFTQSEVDEMIEKRLNRERKKFEKETKKLEESQKEADDSETIKTLRETIKKQNEKLVRGEAEKIAKQMNIDDDFLEAALNLADFSQIDLENSSDIDADDITDIVKAVIDKYPRFVKQVAATEDTNKGFIKTGAPAKDAANDTAIFNDKLRAAMGLK